MTVGDSVTVGDGGVVGVMDGAGVAVLVAVVVAPGKGVAVDTGGSIGLAAQAERRSMRSRRQVGLV